VGSAALFGRIVALGNLADRSRRFLSGLCHGDRWESANGGAGRP